MSDKDAAITLHDVTVSYDREPALHHINGQFNRASLTAIVGPNGAGKSTLIKSLLGLLHPDQGKIIFAIGDKHNIAYLPQQAEIDKNFPISVWDMAALGLLKETGLYGGVTASQCTRIEQALAQIGLLAWRDKAINALSVGQFQRLLFARLLVQDAQIILLDEPFTALDYPTTHQLLEIIRYWHHEGRTIIAVLHELDQIRNYFPTSLLIARELIAWGQTNQVLTETNLARAKSLADNWRYHSASHI